jgi:Relaxase/Mobilisation nuclease domain
LIIKTLKGRSFGGLLDYLFDPQDKSLPREIEARGSPENQRVSEEPPSPDRSSRETDRAGPGKDNPQSDSTEGKQRGDQDDSGKTEHEQRGKLLITNMAGRSKEELREHFETLAALRPDVEVNVLHGILSMPEGDVLSPATKVRIVLRFAELKGLDRTMFAAIEHNEHKHTEIHVISSTIDFKGRLPSDSFDYDRGEAIARQLEKEFGLKPNRSSRDTMQRAPTQGEWKQHERAGKLSRPLRLHALINTALDREVTFTEFQQRLERRGVMLSLLVNDKGKVAGSVYEFEGKHIRGRRLGRGFTWQGLQQDWPDQQERKGRMTYEPARDNEAISRAGSGTMGRRRGATELREPERPVRSVVGDEPANEGTGREAVPHRNPTRQASAVGEEGRAAVRDNCARGKGTARRDGGAPQEHRGESHAVQRTGDDNGGRHQGRVSTSAPNSSGVLRRDAEDKRQKRANGQAMSGYGGDEQRSLSEGQRGCTGGIRENAGTSEGSGRDSSQGDRGAGARLPGDLQTLEQVDRHRDDSNSPVRVRHRIGGRRVVDNNEAASSRGNKALESRSEADINNPDGLYDASLNNGASQTRQPSAVDEVIKTLWGSASSFDDMANKPAVDLNSAVRAEEPESHLKPPDIVTPMETTRREDSQLKSHTPHERGGEVTDSSQGLLQEKQANHREQDRQGRHEPSR